MGNIMSWIRRSTNLHYEAESDEAERDEAEFEEFIEDNRKVFKELQMHPEWGTFFKTFSEDDLVLGSRFAEGGQAELFHVQVDWRNPADRGKRSIIEERIERSKGHWTQLAQPHSSGSNSVSFNCFSCYSLWPCFSCYSVDSEEEEAVDSEEAAAVEVSNRKVFEDLQKQSTFFYKFEKGEMVLGKKFAEGAQGEIYSAQIEWRNSDQRTLLLREGEGGNVLEDPSEYVIKIFKKEYKLQDLKNLFPKAMLEFHAQRLRVWMERRYTCDVVCGTLLEDGRFAFVLQREHADLRALIDRNMDSRKEVVQNEGVGPFRKDTAENFMYETALGMKWLHDHQIVHRDLKAANVLVRLHPDWNYCFVADYECSVGVEGTRLWRAPEILQSFKDRRPHSEREKFYTEQADVYSYGMTCYEILTGKFPSDDLGNNFDLVLQGRRPVVPTYVDGWVKDLLSKCWEFKPEDRYSFEQILHTLEENSRAVKIHIGMKKNLPHSKLSEWDPPKTEVIPPAELARIYSAKQKQRQTQHPSEGIAQAQSQGQFDELYEARNQLQSDWVIKVFRKGTSFRMYLGIQCPQGLFHLHVDRRKRAMTGPTAEWKKPKYICDVLCATLLKDGRFAFLIAKEQQDLRQLIDRRRRHMTVNKNLGPFPKEVAIRIMHHIALGMDFLHSYDIIHRDLRASNVLVSEDEDGNYRCYVTDFEYSGGVLGVGFYRAPEILQCIKDKKVDEIPEVFSRNSDVYGYGMSCYEILTGNMPFENHPFRDYSIVLNGGRPELPSYVDGWVRELVRKCWEHDPMARPSFAEILEEFDTADQENRMSSSSR
ncbi:hypothetical protein KC19_11G076100 [Ceratodon purpureus]|uniref:Protein kinase domain-containing protein n=1 Tax=Ceratodon purpureus TaxID=3225 RepID=A0A8T0GE01_CERPU|nr:hypothetical protein KC19_11G076100 [Ceratodon purpureus]